MNEMSVVQEASEETPTDCLDVGEAAAAFEKLSAADKLKLDAIAAIRARGTRYKPRELLSETLARTWLGERRCPRGVAFMAFLVQTMKSIASHDREQSQRSVPLDEARMQDGDELPAKEYPTEEPNPEEHLAAKETLQRIAVLFAEDEEIQLVMMGWADGLKGRALREATGLDQAGLDYAIKRIRSQVRKFYPSGWKQ